MAQPVTSEDLYNYQLKKPFQMIDNYIYLYHTDTLIALPLFPESITDSMGVSFGQETPMSRTAPIYSYSNSGPRSLQINLPLHRDMMHQINVEASMLKIDELQDEDYIDIMINQLQSIALPAYAASIKMVNPPQIAVRFGNAIFCKGIVKGPVSVEHSGPILRDNKYAMLTVSFGIEETDPYDAATVAKFGGFRGLRTTLDGKIYRNIT